MFKDEAIFNQILREWKNAMPGKFEGVSISEPFLTTNTVGKGFVRIDNREQYHLQEPFHLKHIPGDGYSIAVYHQYHCLYMIMHAHGRLSFGKPEHNLDMQRHVTHCFDYLRQSALCCGDSALEGQGKTAKGMADGWGVQHVCKSNSEVVDWIEGNRFSNNTGIS